MKRTARPGTAALRPVEPEPGVLVHASADRRLAVEHWLLATHPAPEQARREWSEPGGVALLPLGTLFCAVRIPKALVMSAVQVELTGEEKDDYLFDAMVDVGLFESLDGPVICDHHQARYYALAPASMPDRWHKAAAEWSALGVEFLGSGTHLGVPRVEATRADPGKWASHWAVEMESPGMLCDPQAIARLIAAGARRLAKEPGA